MHMRTIEISVGAFVLASLGMAFAGIVAAIPELSQDE